jgi:hypothetical protein
LIAWAAGLFEGEGCITQSDIRLVLRLKMTDRAVVVRFDDILQIGKVYGPYSYALKDGHPRKPAWVWVAAGDEAFDALELLAPWLSERRLARAQELTDLDFHVK